MVKFSVDYWYDGKIKEIKTFDWPDEGVIRFSVDYWYDGKIKEIKTFDL